MVVTGSCPAECGFFRSDCDLFAAWREFGRHLHDAFEHLSNRRSSESIIAMSPLLFDI